MKEFKLKSRTITESSPVYIIAEMSGSHAGSLDNALKIVHTAKECGADCIKIQTYTADTITLNCQKDDFQVKGGLWDGYSLYKLYEEAHTPWEWQARIKEEADNIGLDFFSAPFDFTAVDFLESINVDFYKIASCELVDIALIKYIAKTGKPIMMSTGMATLEEIEEAVAAILNENNNELALLKCSSTYPADPADMNLITIKDLSERFNLISGLSDHSFGSFSAIIGTALGAKIIEKHICLDRNIKNNPDAGFSMEPDEFKQMVIDVRNAEKAIGTEPYTYAQKEIEGRKSRRSLYVSADIKRGEVFTSENIKSVRPAHGINTRHYDEILGKRAACDLEMGTPLDWSMIE